MTSPAILPQPRPASAAGRPSGAGTPVPVSVWPAIPVPGPCPGSAGRLPCPRRYTAAAFTAVITRLSRPGDLVAACPQDGAMAAAAASAGRRVTSLAGGCCCQRAAPPPDGMAAAGANPPGPARGGATLAALAVVTACPDPGCHPAPGGCGACPEPALLFAACQRLLRPGGLLAVITSTARDPARAGGLIARARAAGLVYAQHVVALHAPIDDDHLASPRPRPGVRPGALVHLPVHTDLLVFAKPGRPSHD